MIIDPKYLQARAMRGTASGVIDTERVLDPWLKLPRRQPLRLPPAYKHDIPLWLQNLCAETKWVRSLRFAEKPPIEGPSAGTPCCHIPEDYIPPRLTPRLPSLDDMPHGIPATEPKRAQYGAVWPEFDAWYRLNYWNLRPQLTLPHMGYMANYGAMSMIRDMALSQVWKMPMPMRVRF